MSGVRSSAMADFSLRRIGTMECVSGGQEEEEVVVVVVVKLRGARARG